MTVRVRFAPSPTGFLHIGGARTALFNWLFARHHRGTFILRIEDTDEVRSTQESVQAIFDGLTWLGLDWDEGPLNGQAPEAHRGNVGPYFQMKRLPLYEGAAKKLMEAGWAYPCYCTPAEVDKMRERAQLLKRPPKYDGTCRSLTPAQRDAKAAEGRSHSVRFKSPLEGVTSFEDVVRGPMKFDNALIEDFVIVKTSGVPTYNFACVVDDQAMGITHVIRGDDHLSNTPRQILCAEALGWKPPVYAHLSMILGSDGSRLSKRHGATSVQEYEKAGYLPEALRNYLALLGWATEDSQQIFDPREMVEKFQLERCGRSPAVFDPQKLLWMNGDYLRRMSLEELVQRARPFLVQATWWPQAESQPELLKAALALEHDKLKLLTDVPNLVDFFFQEVVFDPEAVEKVLKKPGTQEALLAARQAFAVSDAWTAQSTEALCKDVALKLGVKNAAIFHPVRVAVSGRTQGPSLFHMLEVLGKESVLKRMDNGLKLTQGLI